MTCAGERSNVYCSLALSRCRLYYPPPRARSYSVVARLYSRMSAEIKLLRKGTCAGDIFMISLAIDPPST